MSPALTAVLATSAIWVVLALAGARWGYLLGRRHEAADRDREDHNQRIQGLEEDRQRQQVQQQFASVLADTLRQDER